VGSENAKPSASAEQRMLEAQTVESRIPGREALGPNVRERSKKLERGRPAHVNVLIAARTSLLIPRRGGRFSLDDTTESRQGKDGRAMQTR